MSASSVALSAMAVALAPAWAQTAQSGNAPQASAESASGTTLSQTANGSDATATEEIIVTGTSIRGAAPTGSPLISIGRDDIVTIGARTTQDIIKTIPSIGAFGAVPVPTNDFGQVGIKPSIHNIGAGATLTLMDGHRLVGAGILQTNPDPSIIPPSAIERIEVVADGASSIYGSDAIAGVLNVILRKNFHGAETSFRYGFADNYHTIDVNQIFGRKWSSGSFMIAGEYTKNDAVFGSERSFVRQDQRPLGYNDLRSNAAIPPNITADGKLYAYPNFSTTSFNLYDTSQVGSLIPDAHRYSIVSTFRQEVTPDIEVYAEGLFSERKSTNTVDPGGATPTIPASNPFFVRVPGTVNAFEVARMELLPIVGALHTPSKLQSMGLTAGVNVKLGHGWEAIVEGNIGHEDDQNDQQVVNATALAAAAAGTTTSTALDPFTGQTSPSVIAGLLGVNASRNRQNLREASAKFDGPLFELPAGRVKLAVGIQYHYESLNQSYDTIGVTNTLTSKLSRNFLAEYAEALIPIFGGDFSFPLLRKVDLAVSVRHDRYNDAGSTTNPKFGVNWSPVAGLTLHGSYGTSFHAPPLADKNPASIDTRVQPLFASTTFAPPGAAPSNYFYLAGSDPNLVPEKAKTWSFGGDYAPPFVPRLRFGATWWHEGRRIVPAE